MGSSRILKEAIDYINLYRDETMVVRISEAVSGESQRLSNVIRDINLLISAGIRIVIVHSDSRCEVCFWQSLEPIVILNSNGLSGIKKKIARRITPVIFFNESAPMDNERAIVALAKEIEAIKIVYITQQDGLFLSKDNLIPEMDIGEARKMLAEDDTVKLEMQGRVEAAIAACEGGISRVHIAGSREGSLLKEILTSEGSGTMIYNKKYKDTRKAKEGDVADIFEVIRESIRQTADSLSLEFVASNIDNFWVFAVDDQIHGCVMVTTDQTAKKSEISYLGVSSVYESPSKLKDLIELAIRAVPKEVRQIFLDPEKNTNWLGIYPWFKQLGFSRPSVRSKWTKKV